MRIADQAHQKIIAQYDSEIAELERQLRVKQEARREYINRNNLNTKPKAGASRG